MYMNPNRADQVLVYVLQYWKFMPLSEAISLAFGHITEGLTDVSVVAPTAVQGMARAASDAFRSDTKARRVVNSSIDAMAAHLGNLTAQLISSACRTQAGGATAVGELEVPQYDGVRPRTFCRERYGHMEAAPTVSTFESELYVNKAADVKEGRIPEMARQLLSVYGRLLIARRPENLTAMFANGVLYTHGPAGWTTMAAAEAARMQAHAFGENIILYIRAQESKLLLPVAAYLESHLDEIAAEESIRQDVLKNFASATSRFYGNPTVRRALAGPQPDG